MRTKLRFLLSAMMFLEYAAWGAWAPILAETLSSRTNATGTQVGAVFGILWLACIITPFIGGQLVDRYMPSQVFLAIASGVCALSAYMMSQQQDVGQFMMWMWVWAIAFAPTLGICNSIAFHHLGKQVGTAAEQEREFAIVRTAGTLGWIIVGWVLFAYFKFRPPVEKGVWAPYEEMQFSAMASVILALFAFFLPHTPPSKEIKDPWAFTKAFALLKTVPGFAVFISIFFICSTEFQFYYVLSSPFIESLGVAHENLPAVFTISQIGEIAALGLFLPWALKNLGMRKTLVIGVFAWPLRYLIFAIGQPLGLVVASLAFHGIGFAFVFVTSQIYVDRVAPKDIRASAQSLLTLVTLGLGNYVGTLFSGWLKDHYTTFKPDPANAAKMIPDTVDWRMVFIVPAVVCILCGIAFWFTFREPAMKDDVVAEADLEPATV